MITLGDIHNSKYEDDFFNIILCGWVLAYSSKPEKILDELLRIIKNKGIISIGFSYHPNQNNLIYSTDQILKKKFEKNISQVYFNFDAYKSDPKKTSFNINY